MFDDDTYSMGAGGKNARENYFRNLAKNGPDFSDAAGDWKKTEKTPEQVRYSNAVYSPPQLDIEQLRAQPRQSPGKNFDRCFESSVEVIGTNISEHLVINTFEQAFWHSGLKKNIKECGYEKPTPVQKYAMPYVMELRDVVACAPTGSGKTAAYILPIISYILQRGDINWILPDREHPAPCALIVVPTRELAEQIKDEARKYAEGTKIQVVSVFGGTNLRAQVDYIRKKGCNILVGTPGRLLQLLGEGRFRLQKVRWVVLDEAHRLLENIDEDPTVRQILEYPELPVVGHARLTVMFSATFPSPIRKIASKFLCDPVFVTIGKSGAANEDIVQEILLVPAYAKYDKLHEMLTKRAKDGDEGTRQVAEKTLVFVERKDVSDYITARLACMGVEARTIHGDREQREREDALREFKAGRCQLLIATAVAGRGLDIVGVDHVVNYDLPSYIEDYVHRIGRTGRVGNPGRATSFYDPASDKAIVEPLVKVLRDAQQEVPEWLLEETGAKTPNKSPASSSPYGKNILWTPSKKR